jgi:hypothetical protein
MRYWLLGMGLLASCGGVMADDCDAILKATEARIRQPHWQSVTRVDDGRVIETIKASGKFYANRDDGWLKVPTNLDDQERRFVSQVRSGQIKLTECKQQGEETVRGSATLVWSMKIEAEGKPSTDVLVYIGAKDGLPYAQSTAHTKTEYKYAGVTVPKLVGK